MPTPKAMPHLLIVEDDAVTRTLLAALLSAEGYPVQSASDGLSGLTAAKSQPPDLAILDLHLPDLSGIELAELLQPDVPFLALTMDRSPAALQACTEKGAMGYLVKPLEAETFLRHVHVALERGREQRNLRRALRDHQAINKAIGVLMGSLRLSEAQAFKALITDANTRNLKTLAVASQILAAMEHLNSVTGSESQRDAAPPKNRAAAQRFLDHFRFPP